MDQKTTRRYTRLCESIGGCQFAASLKSATSARVMRLPLRGRASPSMRRQAGCLSSELGRAPAEPRTMMRRTGFGWEAVCCMAATICGTARSRTSSLFSEFAPRGERTTSAPSMVWRADARSKGLPWMKWTFSWRENFSGVRRSAVTLWPAARQRCVEERSGSSAGAEDGNVHGWLLLFRDWLSSGKSQGCEKTGWGNCIILFCLVNIPTIGTESSQSSWRPGCEEVG